MAELTVGDIRPWTQYQADGVQSVFTYPFPVFAAADLQVVFDDGAAPGSFSVTGVGADNGGNVVFDAPPAAGTRITLRRDMPVARATDFVTAGEFRAAAINEELDKITMTVQQVENEAREAVRRQAHDSDVSLYLPPAAVRVDKVLGFGADGEIAVYDRAATSADPDLGGESNDGLNRGAGEGVYADKSGVTLRFKSLVGGDNISLSSDDDEITIDSTALADVMTAAGDMVVRGASLAERLPLGLAGQILTVNGAGTAPIWATLAAIAGAKVDFTTFSLATDTAASITPSAASGIGFAFGLDFLGDPAGMVFTWRTASGPYCTKLAGVTTAEVTTGALGGTTGNSGRITVSAHDGDGKIYVENRIAGTKTVGLFLISTDPV